MAFYDIVDKMLLDAHMKRCSLASAMDINDFIYVNSVYFPSQSIIVEQVVIVPPALVVPLDEAFALDQAPQAIALVVPPTPNSTPLLPDALLPLATTNVEDVDVF